MGTDGYWEVGAQNMRLNTVEFISMDHSPMIYKSRPIPCWDARMAFTSLENVMTHVNGPMN